MFLFLYNELKFNYNGNLSKFAQIYKEINGKSSIEPVTLKLAKHSSLKSSGYNCLDMRETDKMSVIISLFVMVHPGTNTKHCRKLY